MPNESRPLNGLHAFESAARHLNLRAAAEELGVTPSAVSHQIRGVEAALGVTLFRRANKRLSLTSDGRALLPGLSEGFGRIDQAIAELRNNQQQGVLTISMASTFAMRWFMPRLPRFQQRFPEIEIRIATAQRPVDLEQGDIDAAIRQGDGAWSGMQCDRLFGIETTPVCSPDLLNSNIALNGPEDLHRHTLLHASAQVGDSTARSNDFSARSNDWAQWFAHLGVPYQKPARELTFETTNLALTAAIKGLGVAIADRRIVEEDIESGRLAAPLEQTRLHPDSYFLVCPVAQAQKPKMTHFRHWLMSEIA